MMSVTIDFQYVIIGGGIAGVSCLETLCTLCPETNILLITASDLVKAVTNVKRITKTLESFDVAEQPTSSLHSKYPNAVIVTSYVTSLDSRNKLVSASSGARYHYNKLCLCTGGAPKVIARDNPFVIGIRDTETVKVFLKRLAKARRIVIIGNGGIATELVYQIEGCDVIWAIKDESIAHTFIDAGAADFLMTRLNCVKQLQTGPVKRTKYSLDDTTHSSLQGSPLDPGILGSALGPDWSEGLNVHGNTQGSHSTHVEYNVEVKQLLSAEQMANKKIHSTFRSQDTDEWPVYVELTNDHCYGCDFVVSATGVIPSTETFIKDNKFELSEDGGLSVNDNMQTSVCDVYAAGDVCSASWQHSTLWLQMRLWCQARQMGAYSAQCMHSAMQGKRITLDFCFEMFAHVTKFFNYKVVLLGKFNAQGVDNNNHELLIRTTKDVEYVKLVLSGDRLVGAILIGETDLEEVLENLILNQLDLADFKDHLLDPQIDLEDFFD